jgi:hypothetical protein
MGPGEDGGPALRAIFVLVRVAEDHGRSAAGDARREAHGVGGVASGIDTGHAELALQQPGQQRAGRGRGRPFEIVGAEEPEGVEGRAGGLERTHDLDGRAARLGGEEGPGGDEFELGEGVGEGDARVVEVERREFVEGIFPLGAGLKLDGVKLTDDGPAGGLEQLADGCGPLGVGAQDGAGISAAAERAQRAQGAEQGGKTGTVARAGDEGVEVFQRELGMK